MTVVCCLAACGPASDGDRDAHAPLTSAVTHEALTTAIDSIAADALARGPIAGLSIAVTKRGQPLVVKGYGSADLDKKVPADANTIYAIASVTKLITATAAMILVDSGKLRLDQDLASLLPSFPNREQGRSITVRHLLSHTSGLSNYERADAERWLTAHTPLTHEFVLEYLRDRPLDFEPGTRWSYSSTGFYLVGLIIERVSGQSFESFVREKITQPTGMNTTFQCDERLIPSEMTPGYDVADGKLVPSRLYHEPNVRYDGGLCSTVGDLAKLPAALARGTVLSVAAFDQMTEQTTLANGVTVDYGLGVRRGFIAGSRLWGHTGGWNSFWSALVYFPVDDIAIVVLVNTEDSAEDALTIEGKVVAAVFEMGVRADADVPVPPDVARALSGDYQGEDGRVEISVQHDRLLRKLEDSERPALKLLYKGDSIFGRPDYPLDRIVFHVVDGRSLGLSEYYNGVFYQFSPILDRASGTMSQR